jgi:hypothetical protein
MKKLVIYRTYLPNGTRGIWYDDQGKVFLRTIEPSRNRPEHPCIPEGTFIFERFHSPKHGNVFRGKDIPGREGIEIHIVENPPSEPSVDYVRPTFSDGCILVGLYDCVEHDEPAVCGSHEAFRRYNEYLKDDQSFTLVITSNSKEVPMPEKKDLLSDHNLWGVIASVTAILQGAGITSLSPHDMSMIGIGVSLGVAGLAFFHGQVTRDDIGSILGVNLSRFTKPVDPVQPTNPSKQ